MRPTRIQYTIWAFLLCQFPLLLPAQSTIEQAIFLRQFIREAEPGATTQAYFSEDPDDMIQYMEVLKNYLDIPDSTSEERLSQIISDKLFDNPFINSEDEDGTKILLPNSYSNLIVGSNKNTLQPSIDESTITGYPSAPSGYSAGGFTTKLVDGLSRWLVKRTKQELSLTFFNRFKQALNEQPDLNILFPQTVSLLNVFEDEVYHYQAFIGTLRESFINDFHLIPQNLSEWSETTAIIQDPTERFAIKEAFEIPPMIMNGDKPRDIIGYMGNVGNCPDEFKNVFSSFKVIDLLSNSLFDFRTDGWQFPQEWDSKVDELTLYLYLGLLFEKGENIEFSNGKFTNILNGIAAETGTEKTQQFKTLVYDFLKYGKQTNEFFRTLSSADTIQYPTYHQYTNSVIRFLGVANDFHTKFVSPNPSKRFKQVLHTIENANDLIFHIHQNNFLQSVSHINQIVGNFLPTLKGDELDNLLPEQRKIYETRQKTKRTFLKYSTFMGTVADAQTSEQVEFAFDLFALPPGSSKLKKSSPISVALNAYVGPTFGLEYLENYQSNSIFALHAPVGINLNWGLENNKGSFSLFAPIIDVGAITAFRFGDDTSTLPELSFKNIIAPGVYAVYGFGRDLPFALGVGAQMGPNTRKIEVDAFGNPTENRTDSGFRIGAFLSVDIPVFHFYTK